MTSPTQHLSNNSLPNINTSSQPSKRQLLQSKSQPDLHESLPNKPIQFNPFHLFNINFIHKAKLKFLLNHPSFNKKPLSPMKRLKKIKKSFHINFSSISSNNLLCKHQHSLTSQYIPLINTPKYYYSIIKGNNSELIHTCMKHRLRWKESTTSSSSSSSTTTNVNFIWAPTSNLINYYNLSRNDNEIQIVNHYEGHACISNKLKMFENIMKYCEHINKDIFEYVPMTILIQYDGIDYLRQFKNFEKVFNDINEYIYKGKDNAKDWIYKYRDYFTFGSNNDMHNSNSNKLGMKTNFYINKTHYIGENIWLIKAINLNRGRCIKIANNINDIENIIKRFYKGIHKSFTNTSNTSNININTNTNNTSSRNINSTNSNNNISLPPISKSHSQIHRINYSYLNSPLINTRTYQSSVVILQKYIERPLLYHKRKFDVRMWVLLTHKMEVFVFKEGHLKAASVEFDIKNNSSYVHLTNYSVQKHNVDFSKYEYGNEISIKEFEMSVHDEYGMNISFKNDLFPKLKDVIKLSMYSINNMININQRKFCFEIFGYDFMYDCDFNPFLIEINTNPGLEISSPLIKQLVPRMIDDAFRLTIDTIFISEYSWNTNYTTTNTTNTANPYYSPFHVDEYDDRDNLWDFVCDINKEHII